MTIAGTDGPGYQAPMADLVDALGDRNWRARRAAVERLIDDSTPQLVAQMVETIRADHRDLARLNASIQILTRTEADVVPAMLPLLADADADVRAYVLLALGDRGDARAIPALIDALADTNTNVRVHSIEALGKLRAAAAVDTLARFIESPEFELAFPALDALVAIGDERIAHLLIPLLCDPLLQSAAIEALGTLGDDSVVIPLLSQLGDNSVSPGLVAKALQQIHDRYESRYGAGKAVADIVWHAGTPANVATLESAIPNSTLEESEAIVTVLGWMPGDAAVVAVLDALERPELSRRGVDALVARGPALIPAIVQALETSAKEKQLHLIDVCGRLGDRRLVPSLVNFLQHDDEEVIARVLDALARIGDHGTYENAKALLGHQSARVRQSAVGTVNALGHPATAGDMRFLLHDPSPIVRESAVRIAAYFGFPECIDSVLVCSEQPDARLQRAAIEHLPCLEDDRVLERLTRALESENAELRAAAARAIGEVESDQAIRLLEKALDDLDVWVRYFAVRGLAPIDRTGKTAKRRLSLALDDPAMQVRIAAVETLGAEALHELVSLATNADDDLAAAALTALGAIRYLAAVPTLLLATSSANARKQLEAVRALGKTGLVEAVQPLHQVALRRDQHLAVEAIDALGRIHHPESIDALLMLLAVPAKRQPCIGALTSMGETAVPELARRLQELPIDTRRAAILVLIGIHSRAASDVLETALDDPEPAVRHAALSALTQLRLNRQRRMTGDEGNA